MTEAPAAGKPWPADKLTSLRLGQRLVTEVSASRPGRRAFVDIVPLTSSADAYARREGWKRLDHTRTFRLRHWDYDADSIDGFDYDIGAVLVREAIVEGESDLTVTLQSSQLSLGVFRYPWQTGDPR